MTASGGRQQQGIWVASVATALGNPAAGADWSTAVVAGKQVVAVRAQLATSAVAGSRVPALRLRDSANNVLAEMPAPNPQAASLTEQYTWAIDVVSYTAGTRNVAPLPSGLVVPAGGNLISSTTALDVADQWSAIVVTVAG